MKDFSFLLMVVAALAVFALFRLVDLRRTAAIRALAIRSGFHYIGEALPKSFSLHGTPFERASRVWNVIDGEPRGIRIIAFDCQVGVGRHSWRRSVVAVENGADFLAPASFGPDMKIESAGKWTIAYHPKPVFEFRIAGLIPIERLEGCLNSVGAVASRG